MISLLLGLIFILTGCTVVSSASRLNTLEKIVQENGEADNVLSEYSAQRSDDLQEMTGNHGDNTQPGTNGGGKDSVLSTQMQALIQNGLRIIDQKGNTVAWIKQFPGAEGYENTKDGIMVILNVNGIAVEFFPTDAGGVEEYFEKYAAVKKYTGPEYNSFLESDMQTISLQCISGGEHVRESRLSGWWKRYNYRTGGKRFAEYFCAIPYQTIDREGMISVHMRIQLSMSDPGNHSDNLFLQAAGSVVPYTTYTMKEDQ